MKKDVGYITLIAVLPFIATAAIEFLPWWLSFPTTFLSVVLWLGAYGMLTHD